MPNHITHFQPIPKILNESVSELQGSSEHYFNFNVLLNIKTA